MIDAFLFLSFCFCCLLSFNSTFDEKKNIYFLIFMNFFLHYTFWNARIERERLNASECILWSIWTFELFSFRFLSIHLFLFSFLFSFFFTCSGWFFFCIFFCFGLSSKLSQRRLGPKIYSFLLWIYFANTSFRHKTSTYFVHLFNSDFTSFFSFFLLLLLLAIRLEWRSTMHNSKNWTEYPCGVLSVFLVKYDVPHLFHEMDVVRSLHVSIFVAKAEYTRMVRRAMNCRSVMWWWFFFFFFWKRPSY